MSAAADTGLPPGIPCWVNLTTGDLHATRTFYEAVLGWEFRAGSLGAGYLVAWADGSPVAGIGEGRAGLPPLSLWTPYFAVPDAGVTGARIRERGATLAVGPVELGEGRAGLAADRDGATFGFWEGPTPAWSGAHGSAPVRLDLQSSDLFEAAVFYGGLFGWAQEPTVEISYRHDHVLVERNGQVLLTLRGGGVHTSADPQALPRWLVSFAVDDVERAVTTAVAAGGGKSQASASASASVSGAAPRGFSRTLQDPQGGLFTVRQRRP